MRRWCHRYYCKRSSFTLDDFRSYDSSASTNLWIFCKTSNTEIPTSWWNPICTKLWVSFGKGRAKAWYPIHEYAKNIGLQNIKLSFYALSGCEIVSLFKNKGKVITSDMRGIFRHYWHIFKTKKLSSRLRHNWWTSCRKVHIFYFKMWLPMFKLLF